MKVKCVLQLGLDEMRSWGDVAVALEGLAAMIRDRRGRTSEPEHGEGHRLPNSRGDQIGAIEVVTNKEADITSVRFMAESRET